MATNEKQALKGFDPRRLHQWIAFGLGSGLSPWAPGTMGTLAAVPFYLLLSPLAWPYYLALLAGLTGLGGWACGRTAQELGSKDPPAIVWDEWVGFWVTMAVVPHERISAPGGWLWILAGFALFRLFDIWKPWPIGAVDARLGGGLGIMLDDILAGLLAACVLWMGLVWF